MVFESGVTVGDILTSVSVLIGAATLLFALAKDRRMRNREFADRVRKSSAIASARLLRWSEVASALYDAVQPALTEADGEVVRGDEVHEVRDKLWRSIVECRSSLNERLSGEQLELAFAEAQGFDATVQTLFDQAVAAMRHQEDACVTALLNLTQVQVLRYASGAEHPQSAELGNRLRAATASVQASFETNAASIVASFREISLRILRASDSDIVRQYVEMPHALRLKLSSVPTVESFECSYQSALEAKMLPLGGAFIYKCLRSGSSHDEMPVLRGNILRDKVIEHETMPDADTHAAASDRMTRSRRGRKRK